MGFQPAGFGKAPKSIRPPEQPIIGFATRRDKAGIDAGKEDKDSMDDGKVEEDAARTLTGRVSTTQPKKLMPLAYCEILDSQAPVRRRSIAAFTFRSGLVSRVRIGTW